MISLSLAALALSAPVPEAPPPAEIQRLVRKLDDPADSVRLRAIGELRMLAR